MSTIKQSYIIGAGDLGREVLSCIVEINDDKEQPMFSGFIDDFKHGNLVEGYNVYPFLHLNEIDLEHSFFIIAVGNPDSIKELYMRFDAAGVKNWLTVIHPKSFVAKGVEIGQGSYIAANSSLAIGTKVGNWCIVNQICSIGHDVILGAFSVISPGCILSGRTTCGDGVFFGSGAITVPKISIGSGSVIGANTVVNHSIAEKTKVMPVIRNIETPL